MCFKVRLCQTNTWMVVRRHIGEIYEDTSNKQVVALFHTVGLSAGVTGERGVFAISTLRRAD